MIGLVGNNPTAEKRCLGSIAWLLRVGAQADRDSRAAPPLWELRERAFLG